MLNGLGDVTTSQPDTQGRAESDQNVSAFFRWTIRAKMVSISRGLMKRLASISAFTCRLVTSHSMAGSVNDSMAVSSGDEARPEYERYDSLEHFFNEKRQNLLNSMPLNHRFRTRVVAMTRGRRVWPLPPGRHRYIYSATGATEARRRFFYKKRRQEKNDAQYYLAKNQLVTMWNSKLFNRAQYRELAKATPKMNALIKRYRLVEFYDDGHGPEVVDQSRKRKERHDVELGTFTGDDEAGTLKKKAQIDLDELDWERDWDSSPRNVSIMASFSRSSSRSP